MNIPCLCPPKVTRLRDGDSTGPDHTAVRHPDGDTVSFRERLDFRSSLAIRNSIAVLSAEDGETSVAEILAVLTESYLLYGIERWTLVDEKGKPVEVSKAAIRERLLSHPDIAMTVGDEADSLYAEAVMLPLLARAQTSSPPTPTNGSTSATRGRSRSPKRSKPSSITTIPTAATETTSSSLVGGSSSSPNLTLAG
jgi:hypothetical protein